MYACQRVGMWVCIMYVYSMSMHLCMCPSMFVGVGVCECALLMVIVLFNALWLLVMARVVQVIGKRKLSTWAWGEWITVA